jgi:hypothetical protein
MEQKMLFLYLLTTHHTDQLGIYTANLKYIGWETGIKNVEATLKSLYPEVIYIPELKLVFVKNFIMFQNAGGSYEKAVYNRYLELPEAIQKIILRESKPIRAIVEKYGKVQLDGDDDPNGGTKVKKEPPAQEDPHDDPTMEHEVEAVDPPGTGGARGVDGGSAGNFFSDDRLLLNNNLSNLLDRDNNSIRLDNTVLEKNINISGYNILSNTEKENLKENNISTTVEEAKKSRKSFPSNGEQKQKQRKYPPEVVDFVAKFKEFREKYLGVPITHRNWHLKAYAVAAKLLKKYTAAELEQALQDLQTPVWDDKATKILEMWHFEDWLPKWKIWKQGKKPAAKPKTEEELLKEEVERVLRWAFPNLNDFEFKDNFRLLYSYRKSHGEYPFDVPEEIIKGGDMNGIPRGA